jgi:hypothetical protein
VTFGNVGSAGATRPPDGHEPTDPQQASSCRELSEQDISTLVGDIDRNGYGVLAQYVSPADMDVLRRFVRNTVAAAGYRYIKLAGPAAVTGTVLETMASSPALKRVCMRVCEIAISGPIPDQPYYQIVRCLTGSSGRNHSMVFHFDSYILTLLLPIEVPAGTDSGELIILPNVRRIRRWYARNLVDKILLDNPVTQRLLRGKVKAHPERFVRIPMVPGDLYFFWGYRSVHTNAPCDVDKIRATALFHYVDPHRDSRLRKLLRRSV